MDNLTVINGFRETGEKIENHSRCMNCGIKIGQRHSQKSRRFCTDGCIKEYLAECFYPAGAGFEQN